MTYKVEEVGRSLDKFLREIKGWLPLLETESEHIREFRTRTDSEVKIHEPSISIFNLYLERVQKLVLCTYIILSQAVYPV